MQAPWVAFYGDVPPSLSYPDKTLTELIVDNARQYPNAFAYEFMGRKTTYHRFIERIEATAKALVAMGIGKGDRVTIAMPNCPQAVDMFYALNRIGAVSNMIHPLSAPREYAFYLNFSKSKAVLVLDRFYNKIIEIREQLAPDLKVIVACIPDELNAPMKLGYRLTAGRKTPALPKDDGYMRWHDFMAAGTTVADLPDSGMSYTDGAVILYSGGTTGTTKGILLSNLNFNALAMQTAAASGFSEFVGTRMLSVMPMFHGFGLGVGIHTALVGGAMCILVPQFTIKSYAKILRKKKPHFVPGVPTLFEALLRTDGLKNADLSFLKGVFSGGDSLSMELKRKVDAFLKEHGATVQIREGYGTTECVTASCLTPKEYHRTGSIGVPFPDMYYKIVKPGTTEDVLVGEEGEIVISGPTVMIEYIDNSEETAQTLRRHADGKIWLHTGDLGVMDADGFVYFRQRIKRMIVTSGYNVYPSQIENIIDSHEKVLYSCVIGVKDSYRMQKVKAFVVLRPEYTPNEELKQELLQHCRKNVSRYACPSEIEFRPELPKTLVGKVAYRVLEEEENGK